MSLLHDQTIKFTEYACLFVKTVCKCKVQQLYNKTQEKCLVGKIILSNNLQSIHSTKPPLSNMLRRDKKSLKDT